MSLDRKPYLCIVSDSHPDSHGASEPTREPFDAVSATGSVTFF